MNILLIGATGMIGSRVAAEAKARGHQITGVTRSGAEETQKMDASDATAVAEFAVDHDAVVLAIPAPRDGSPQTEGLLTAGRGVLEGLREAKVRRLVVVGGAASLEVAPGVRLVDTPEFPAEYKGEALAQCALLDLLKADAGDLEWTYISPAIEIAPGERRGTYRKQQGDQILADAQGKSFISAEDYAVALVDELEQGNSIGHRMGVAY